MEWVGRIVLIEDTLRDRTTYAVKQKSRPNAVLMYQDGDGNWVYHAEEIGYYATDNDMDGALFIKLPDGW
jgi:hypothetical protein